MGTSFRRSGSKGIITIEGEITLNHAEELRKVLMKAVIDSDDIRISFKNIREIDLSCLQLLCSAHRTAVRLKKRIVVQGPAPAVYKKMISEAGFSRQSGCKLDTEKSCLWAAVQER